MSEYIFGENNNGENENRTNENVSSSAPSNNDQGYQPPVNTSVPSQNTYTYNSGNSYTTNGDPYQNPNFSGGNPYQQYTGYQQSYAPTKKKKNGKKVLAVVSLVLAFFLVSGGAGFGGFLIAKRMNDTVSDQDKITGSQDFSDSEKDVVSNNDNSESGKNDHVSAGVSLTPDSAGTKDKGTIAEVVANVADSVVEITTEYATVNSFYYTQGAGSGVIVNENGYIITNNHVINDDDYGIAAKIIVRTTDGTEYTASVIGSDSDSDIAVLKIDATGLKAAVIGTSSSLAVGEEIVIIGNPLGTLGGTVTNGIISALDREITVGIETMNLLQTNAAVNPGNSGGGMFNLAGELVGIVNAKYSESGIEGLGFAIPIDDAAYVANEILEYGYVRGRVSLHISTIDIDSYTKATYYRVNSLGLYVYEADEGFNDDVLQNGDRIAQIDNIEITCAADLKAVLKKHEVGDTLTAVIVRNGRYNTVTITCYERTVSGDDVNFDNAA